MTIPRFPYLIGNPPYQDTPGANGSPNSIYPEFVLVGSMIADRSVMIHPARAFIGVSRAQPSTMDRIFASDRYTVEFFEYHADRLFPSVDITGGMMVTKHDVKTSVQSAFEYVHVTDVLLGIINTVQQHTPLSDHGVFATTVHSNSAVFSEQALTEHRASTSKISRKILTTSVFEKVPEMFTAYHGTTVDAVNPALIDGNPEREQVIVLGREDGQRVLKVLDRALVEYKTEGHWTVYVPSANGTASLGRSERPTPILGKPVLSAPWVAATQTFLAVGVAHTPDEARALYKYVHTRFVRTLVGALKTTQHNNRSTWRLVPTQDFSQASDIDWSQDVDGLDAQLSTKYGLSAAQHHWVLQHVQHMEPENLEHVTLSP